VTDRGIKSEGYLYSSVTGVRLKWLRDRNAINGKVIYYELIFTKENDPRLV
jgi:hypothetical protein